MQQAGQGRNKKKSDDQRNGEGAALDGADDQGAENADADEGEDAADAAGNCQREFAAPGADEAE